MGVQTCRAASTLEWSSRTLLEYTLVTHRNSLAQGTFPSDRFSQHFKNRDAPFLDALVEQDIEAHDPVTATRRKVLLTFWGDAPRALVDLDLSIHDAFDISAVRSKRW